MSPFTHQNILYLFTSLVGLVSIIYIIFRIINHSEKIPEVNNNVNEEIHEIPNPGLLENRNNNIGGALESIGKKKLRKLEKIRLKKERSQFLQSQYEARKERNQEKLQQRRERYGSYSEDEMSSNSDDSTAEYPCCTVSRKDRQEIIKKELLRRISDCDVSFQPILLFISCFIFIIRSLI